MCIRDSHRAVEHNKVVGWWYCCHSGLSHCRHLKTVRTHLSGLVHSPAVSMVSPTDASAGLTADVWQQMKQTGLVRPSFFFFQQELLISSIRLQFHADNTVTLAFDLLNPGSMHGK